MIAVRTAGMAVDPGRTGDLTLVGLVIVVLLLLAITSA
jgi:hypothetical protein